MFKSIISKHTWRKGILERKKYIIEDISRTQINLPPNHSTLSITKYFEDSEGAYERKKKEETDW